MIDFNINGKKLASFKKFMWSYDGMYLLRLISLDITSKDGVVYPYYKPALCIERHPGQVAISLIVRNRSYSLILQKAEPFVGFEAATIKYPPFVVEMSDED